MANLVLTNGTNSISVALNDYESQEGKSNALLNKRLLSLVKVYPSGITNLFIFPNVNFLLSVTAGNGILVVDSIDGVPMGTNAQLYDALALILV